MTVGVLLLWEIAFWAFLLGGLAARYVLRRPRLGWALLWGSPMADAALLVLTAVDLHNGADAGQVHALAAVYLGFTVVFGRRTVEWADQRFVHRFAAGPPALRPPRTGPARVEHEWHEFRRAVLAWALSCAILGGLTLLIGDLARAHALLGTAAIVTMAIVLWFVTGPVSAILSATGPRPAIHSHMSAVEPRGDPVTAQQKPSDASTRRRWAPWWVYVITILGANYVRQALMPVGTVPEWSIMVIVAAISVTLFALLTCVQRFVNRH